MKVCETLKQLLYFRLVFESCLSLLYLANKVFEYESIILLNKLCYFITIKIVYLTDINLFAGMYFKVII